MKPGTVLSYEEAMVSAKQGSPWRRHVAAQREAERDARRATHIARIEEQTSRVRERRLMEASARAESCPGLLDEALTSVFIDSVLREGNGSDVDESTNTCRDVTENHVHRLELHCRGVRELIIAQAPPGVTGEPDGVVKFQLSLPVGPNTQTLARLSSDSSGITLHVNLQDSVNRQATTEPAAMGGAA